MWRCDLPEAVDFGRKFHCFDLANSQVELIFCCGIARRGEGHYHAVMRTISLKLPDDLLAQLEVESRARRVTKSSLIRESLTKVPYEQASARKASCYDVAADLAGTVKGLPEDLADDPKYMADFGK